MIRITVWILCFAGLLLTGCIEEASVAPDWEVTTPRIVALTADKPVFSPGDTVNFSALVVGLDLAMRTATLAEWRLGNTLQSVPLDHGVSFNIPVAEEIHLFFGESAAGDYIAHGSARVTASLTVRLPDGTTLHGRKDFLLATPKVKQTLAYQNPVIERILVAIPGDGGLSLDPGAPVVLPAATKADRVGLSVALAKNDAVTGFRYRWYLERNGQEKVLLYGTAASASVEVGMPRFAPVTVHLVVEDATEEEKERRYCGGVTTLSFMVTTGGAPTDTDEIESDADTLLLPD